MKAILLKLGCSGHIANLLFFEDTCLGYNSVYAVSGDHFRNEPSLPDGKRVWSWLILCEDGM